MKYTIKTEALKDVVTRVMKGASCNKMIPITGMLGIRTSDGTLTLTTTDASNYLYVSHSGGVGDNFNVTVDAAIFSKLVLKLTCETVVLEPNPRFLGVTGNGTYRVELPLDEEGIPVKFPDPVDTLTIPDTIPIDTVHLSTIKLILTAAKPSLALSADAGCYTGYYCGKKIIATDSNVMCGIDVQLFHKPVLISSPTMDMLTAFDSEKISVVILPDDHVLFQSDNRLCCMYSKLMDSIGYYRVNDVNAVLNSDYGSSCRVNKFALSQLLDRLSLFVSPYDKNGIRLAFGINGLQVESINADSVEVLPYTASDNFEAFVCGIDIELFRIQVKASTGNEVEIHYGSEESIKIVDGNVTQVIGLMQ